MSKFTLDTISNYQKMGFCFIPLPYKSKKPIITWKKYQTEKPSIEEIEYWFKNDNKTNIAVICGKVSNNLTIRDFDTIESYNQWKTSYPELANILPTVNTSRGKHVYFRSTFSKIEHINNEGELRGAGYTLFPPSVHPSGVPYSWDILLSEDNLLELNPFESGFIPNIDTSLQIQPIQQTQQINSRVTTETPHHNTKTIESVIVCNIPQTTGIRNRKIFDLAKAIKYLPEYSTKNPRELKPIFDIWFEKSVSTINTKDYDESWTDFIIAWDKIDILSIDIEKVFEKSLTKKPPPILLEYYPNNKDLHLLACFCRELQISAGKKPFFLSTRTGKRFLNVSHQQVGKLLKILVIEKILELVEKGGQQHNPRKASRFFYIGD